MIEFIDDDEGYLRWLRLNPHGYVLNTSRSKPPNYMVLHAAGCYSISKLSKNAHPRGFTERQYIKICSESIEDLRRWVRNHDRADGSFSSECSLCKPE